MEATSEQELKQLLNEGKITEEEYQELLEAIHQKNKPQPPIEKPPLTKSRSGFGKAALILMIAGFVVPIATIVSTLLLIPAGVRLQFMVFPFILLGMLCELLAFIFGVIGWRSKSGKIAAIGVPCMGLLFIPGLMLLFFMPHRVEVHQSKRGIESRKAYPLDSIEGVLTQAGVKFDEHISSDGNGSLRIQTDTSDKTVIRLFETGPISAENQMLIYSAKLKSEGLDGKAYLEMWCDIPGGGEFFSRGLERPVTGTTEWTTAQTPFRLETGQMPANVKLNLVIEGAGTVWIDDIKLLLSPSPWVKEIKE